MKGENGNILTWTTLADRGFVAQPALTPHLQFHQINEAQVLLLSESFNTLLHGKVHCRLLPLLDGSRSQKEIIESLSGMASESDILGLLYWMSKRGYIVSADHSLGQEQASFWSFLGATPRWAEERLRSTPIHLCDEGEPLAVPLRGLGVRSGDEKTSLNVRICANYLEGRLADVNRLHLKTERPWLLVRPLGMEPMVGPVFRADGDGPCWDCLVSRMRCHQEVHEFLRGLAGEDAGFKPIASPPVALEMVYRMVATEIAKWVVLGKGAIIHDHVVAINLRDLSTSNHPVQRRVQCQVCGDPALNRSDREPQPLKLSACPRGEVSSTSGSRTVAPEITLAKYQHLVSRISGVVTWLRRTTEETDSWLHVYWAGSNLGLKINTLSSLRRGLRSKSAGKGSHAAQSKVSALCEALERYSGGRLGDEICLRKKSLVDFTDDEAIHPNDVQLFSDNQLNHAELINAEGHPYNRVPARILPDTLVDWTPVWSFTQNRHRYLPTSMLYMTAPEYRQKGDLFADTNGCAAGNSLEEAILQGFLELVERDAFAIWWYNRLQVPEIKLTSFDDPFLASAPQYYGQYEREIWLLNITSDFAIPTYVALSRRANGKTEDIIYGAGSHLDARIAAVRAVCELNQCLTWLPRSGEADGRPMIDDPMALSWWEKGKLADCQWLIPDGTATSHPPPKGFQSNDVREEVEYCRHLVEDKKLEFLVLDQTRPDIGLPVVRVLVPGLRHFWARFAPGRLYDIPVQMGKLAQPLRESELNSVPVVS